MKKENLSLEQKRNSVTNRAAAVFLTPVIILLIIYIFYPIIETFRISAFKWNGISAEPRLIGIDNWNTLLHDRKFWIAFLIT